MHVISWNFHAVSYCNVQNEWNKTAADIRLAYNAYTKTENIVFVHHPYGKSRSLLLCKYTIFKTGQHRQYCTLLFRFSGESSTTNHPLTYLQLLYKLFADIEADVLLFINHLNTICQLIQLLVQMDCVSVKLQHPHRENMYTSIPSVTTQPPIRLAKCLTVSVSVIRSNSKPISNTKLAKTLKRQQ